MSAEPIEVLKKWGPENGRFVTLPVNILSYA